MSDPINVLVWGMAKEGPCHYFRGGMYEEELAKRGVNVRSISKVDTETHFIDRRGKEVAISEMPRDRLSAELASGEITPVVEVKKEDLEWADVVVFRRYYNTAFKCAGGCDYLSDDLDDAMRHEHPVKPQDNITKQMWPLWRDHWTGGILYETDDLHISHGVQKWNGYWKDVRFEKETIADMVRRADLVTVATPALARFYGALNPRVRVVRNAIDPDLYVKDTPRPEGDKPRLVYYGSTARLRDYAGYPNERGKWEGGFARKAVDENRHLLRRVFLGTNAGTEEVIAQLFDEQHPYVEGIAAFSKRLANSHGDIGIAPLGGDEFDRCKSELHWIEYAMCDMAFIGERFSGDGPYQVIRDGIDGLLVRGRQQWYDAVRKLASSKTLREDMAGAAKERVLADYDFRKRADEWAEAYRFAAENPGIGARKAVAA